MATGISKTKWTGDTICNEEFMQNPSIPSLAYKGKLSESDILDLPYEDALLFKQIGKPYNQLYYGDNLPILLSFLKNNEIKGNINLIYIDPPFATKSVFQSRSQTDAYCDLLAGTNYIEFMRRRLVVLRELLADNGSIYVHLDSNMIFYIKIIMDEIFGVQNFRSLITRKKCNPKNYTKKNYGNISDFILFYTKSDNYIWHRPFDQWTPEKAKKEYQYLEAETGRYYKKVPIHAPGTRNGETGQPWRGMSPPAGKHWQFSPKTLDEMDKRGEIFWSKNGNPRRKIYLDQSQGIPVQDIWLDYKDPHNQNIKITGYPTEKNPDLLARIIQASSNDNDLILDCFAGSGTSLDIASKLNRKWIGIDQSLEAIRTIINRFKNGCDVMGDFVSANCNREVKRSQQLSIFDNNINSKNTASNFTVYSLKSLQSDLFDLEIYEE
ncbi:site-specific DNA-methyltransferase [Spirulina subsalsa]|uniref:site-specific DNA-methyltransferase n=1 Tax=Spirulina subsalsa TaxID=54311 RepID=UPI000474C96B|nr:site-specific DNA-methyltransferase [Spirulina subsalsa]